MSIVPPTSRLTVLITGPTLGIGKALARRFARDGYRLVLVSRDGARLEETARELALENAIILPADLSSPDAARNLVQELNSRGVAVDILVNNAGFGIFGFLADADPEATRRMIVLNMLSLTELTQLLLPGMLERGRGSILNVASTAAFAPGPLMAVYYATKAYVLSFSDALANELQGSPVTITCLCPGPTRTSFQERAGMHFSPLVSGAIMDAEPVAEAGYRGLLKGKRTVIPGFKNRLLTTVASLMPRYLAAAVIRFMQQGKRRR